MPDIERIAASLTKAQREALATFDGQWVAGPSLSDSIIAEIAGLRELGLIERQFADEGPPRQSVGADVIHVRLSACWHFRITPLGTHLTNGGQDG